MADAQTGRLCTQIIHSQFGPLTANVASVLLTRGRLTLPQVVRFTSIKPRTVRACIIVLVQHNVLWHAQSEDEGGVFELNIEECLLRLRFGRFVWQAAQLFGDVGAEVVQLILDHGKLRPPDVISRLSRDAKAAIKYSQVLHALVTSAYLKPSTILSHVSPRDKRIRYLAEEKAKIAGFPTAKELREAKEAADARLKREEAEAEKVGIKRKAPEQKGPRGTKRKVVEEEDVVDPTVYFRVNCEKFNIHIRNALTVRAAKERFNDGAALVLQATLKLTESKQENVSDIKTEPISISNITLSLADEENLASGLVLKTKKPTNSACIQEYLAILACTDNPTPAGRAAAFISLAASKAQVEFETVSKRIRRRVLESVTRERHGLEGLRILRLLLDMGKMDEKQISKVVMIPGPHVRNILALMSAESLISTQEVSKSADRNPARMFYLWHVDLQKAYSVILGNLYKTLYNIGARRQAEREEPMVKAVLEKRERSDVSQDEEALMSRMELDVLKEWEGKQEKLTVLEMRVEESKTLFQHSHLWKRRVNIGKHRTNLCSAFSMLVELNKSVFNSRVQRIYQGWRDAAQNEDYSSVADTDALLLVAGDPAPEDEPTRKGTCVQQWLLGYEFPSTFILFEENKITILCSASKAKILSQIEGSSATVPVEILAQAKGKEPANDALPRFFALYASKKRVGTLQKEVHRGKLIDEWKKLLADASEKPELVDMGPALSASMAVKDADELKNIQIAGALTSTLLKYYVADKLESILDKESKISHEMLAAQIEARLGSGEGDNAKPPDAKVWSRGKGLTDIDWALAEFCYPPIIISRSSSTGYDLRYTAESTSDNISHKGVLLVAFGLRYKSYCGNVGRTFIVDPTPEQEAQYNILLALQQDLLTKMKHGISARDAYEAALSFVKEKNPDLEKHFQKNIGFGTGIEFRDSPYLLSPKNGRILKENMTFSLSLGFTSLIDSGGNKYALQLVDTIKVESDKSILLTDGTRSTKDTMFFLTPEDEEVKPRKKPPVMPRKNGSPPKKTVAGKVLRNQTRRTQDEVHQTAAAKLAEHQRELHKQLQVRGVEKFSEEGAGKEGKEGKGWKKFQSYKGEAGLPADVDRLRIHIDRKNQSVILPVHGFAVPFHINTIKNASKNDEGEFTYLRINFQTPGQLAGKKEDTPFEDPDASFIRSVVFRSPDGHRFDTICKQITDLKKEANKREQQKKEMADVIEQGNLVELKSRRPAKLPEAFIRPALDGRRLAGEVEVHQNGVRYLSPNGQKVDVLFSNVKHLFFQPCDHEMLVIVHLHLKAPIIIGKKKTFDVQFVREATDAQFDETGNRKRKHRYGDEDEIDQEHHERKRRQMLNKEVESFAQKISDAATASIGDTLDLDSPFRELSFEGVPYRASVRLQPTTECLVHLTDPPFLVMTLADIEIASLERVQYNLKQFDLCFIFKDFTRSPLHINSIQSTQMDDVKNWLDSVDIPMTESPVNFNWGPIMKTINEDPHSFFHEGGWSFVGRGNGADSGHSDDGSETESEFEADSEELVEAESTDDESAYGDSGGSDESGSDFGGGSDESDGEDWDELERKAAKSDQKRVEGATGRGGGSDSDNSDKPKKKKSTNGKTKGKR